MARMVDYLNTILPCQEAFLVDAPTPRASPHRWIQAKPESTDGFVGWPVWGRVAAGLGCVCGRGVWGRAGLGLGCCGGLVALGVRLRCAGRGAAAQMSSVMVLGSCLVSGR